MEALRASPVVYADETGWKQGGRRVWLWVFTNLRETVYEILPGRGFEQAASVLGKNYAGTLGVDGWAPYRCFKEATLQTCYNHLLVATSYWRRPRAGRCASHAWSRPSSGTPSPCAIGAMLARSARMACALPRDSSRRRFPAARPIHQSCQPRFAKHLRRYRDNLFVFLDRADARGHQLSRRTRHSHRRGQPQDLRRRQPYRERGTGPVDPHERPPELPSQRDSTSSRQSFVLPTTPPSP